MGVEGEIIQSACRLHPVVNIIEELFLTKGIVFDLSILVYGRLHLNCLQGLDLLSIAVAQVSSTCTARSIIEKTNVPFRGAQETRIQPRTIYFRTAIPG